jgi:dynein heavy chain, axonemal
MIEKEGNSIDENEIYSLPVAQEYEGFIKHIKGFPSEARPGVFGLHENANIIRDQQETGNLLNNILTTQVNVIDIKGIKNSSFLLRKVIFISFYFI